MLVSRKKYSNSIFLCSAKWWPTWVRYYPYMQCCNIIGCVTCVQCIFWLIFISPCILILLTCNTSCYTPLAATIFLCMSLFLLFYLWVYTYKWIYNIYFSIWLISLRINPIGAYSWHKWQDFILFNG